MKSLCYALVAATLLIAAQTSMAMGLLVDGPVAPPAPPASSPAPAPISKVPTEPTTPCNLRNDGSVSVVPFFDEWKATCTGTDCDGKNLSVPYVSHTSSGVQVSKCRYVKADELSGEGGPIYPGSDIKPNAYNWMMVCFTRDEVDNVCQPKMAPCPKCKPTDPPKYWAQPEVAKSGEEHYDGCAEKVANPDAALSRSLTEARATVAQAHLDSRRRFDSSVATVFRSSLTAASSQACAISVSD